MVAVAAPRDRYAPAVLAPQLLPAGVALAHRLTLVRTVAAVGEAVAHVPPRYADQPDQAAEHVRPAERLVEGRLQRARVNMGVAQQESACFCMTVKKKMIKCFLLLHVLKVTTPMTTEHLHYLRMMIHVPAVDIETDGLVVLDVHSNDPAEVVLEADAEVLTLVGATERVEAADALVHLARTEMLLEDPPLEGVHQVRFICEAESE